jgi:hypothetical protein
LSIDRVVLKRIPGQKQKIRTFLERDLAHLFSGFETSGPDLVCRAPGMDGTHSDLPICCMNESHETIIRVGLAQIKSYLEFI